VTREDALRLDVALHRLCLTRSRSEAKAACEAGAVTLGSRPGRPSDTVLPGSRITLRTPARTLELEIDALPGRNVSRGAARELYRVLREERVDDDPFA
jgi:ribosomal 50S subunit-recycling heat shock protein